MTEEKTASLEFQFLISPEDFPDADRFADFLGKLFGESGFDCERVSGDSGKRVIRIRQKDDLESKIKKSMESGKEKDQGKEPEQKVTSETLGKLIKISLEGFE